jgi:hypothetical protein
MVKLKNNGQIAQIDGYIGSNKQWQQKFGYDSLGRLKAASESQVESGPRTYLINYDYDRFNNRFKLHHTTRSPIILSHLLCGASMTA